MMQHPNYHLLSEYQKEWIDALLSGKFNQTTGRLRYKDSFCCLGVACETVGKHFDIMLTICASSRDEATIALYAGQEVGLPVVLVNALSMCSSIGHAHGDFELMLNKPFNGISATLAELNDSGYSFREIANTLLDNPDRYFRNINPDAVVRNIP
jgi:hypothetical protein